jgi:hypothetical protein
MSHRGHQTTAPNVQQNPLPLTSIAWQASHAEPRARTPSSSSFSKSPNGRTHTPLADPDDFSDPDTEYEFDEMGDRRPALHRPTDGRSHTPLLHKDDDERGRTGYDASPDLLDRPPTFSRRSTMRSRSPDTQAKLATRKKYTYAAFFLGLSLVSFVVQTETAVYIQHELGWNKAYCML